TWLCDGATAAGATAATGGITTPLITGAVTSGVRSGASSRIVAGGRAGETNVGGLTTVSTGGMTTVVVAGVTTVVVGGVTTVVVGGVTTVVVGGVTSLPGFPPGAGLMVGGGVVTEAVPQPLIPAGITSSPFWCWSPLPWPLPVVALVLTVISTNGFVTEPVAWQIVILSLLPLLFVP